MMATSTTRSRTRAALLRIAFLAAIVALLALAPSWLQSNSAAAATPVPNCGAGYRTISSADRGHGIVKLMFRDSDRTACLTFRKTRNVGTATDVGVRLYRPLGSITRRDRGAFQYFAGPIYVHVPTQYANPDCAINTWYVNAQGEWRQHGFYSCAAF